MIRLQTKVRGISLVVSEPDVRYRRYHTDVMPAPEETLIGRAIRVIVPARLADGGGTYPAGTVLCAAYSEWHVDGQRVDPTLYVTCDGFEDRWGKYGSWALLDPLEPKIPYHPSVQLAGDDPELLALRAELAELDAAWRRAAAAEIAAENERSDREIERVERRIESEKQRMGGHWHDDPDEGEN